MDRQMLELCKVSLDELCSLYTPTQKIHTEHDVQAWKSTRGYADYALFLRRLNEAVVGHYLPLEETSPSPAIKRLLSLLDTLDSWIDEIPPLETPQRFGNLAFRTWGQRLEDETDFLLAKLLTPDFALAIPYIRAYFLDSFGSFLRMDYGTGHETSFALFLFCLTLLRVLSPTPVDERDLVLLVFVRYVRLCWRLQDTYQLEPAGSHGVWGLDDSCFLPYVFGSGQLRDQKEVPVNAVLKTPLPKTNLYFMAIDRIREVKTGPFHEHSSQLYSVATSVPNWVKVNTGLFKMYEAEVLGKRVVVQHIPLGGLLEWDLEEFHAHTNIATQQASVSTQAPWAVSGGTQAPWATQRQASAGMPAPGASSGTQAPWASSSAAQPSARGMWVPGTQAPWGGARSPEGQDDDKSV